jgi:phenylacetate-CoA ligase
MGRVVVQELALGRLNDVVERLRSRVPFYKDRLGHGPLQTLDDFAALPFTTKDDFRATYPFGLFAVPMEQVVRLHMSSGTTGKPVVVGYTARDVADWAESMSGILSGAGVNSSDVIQNAFPYGLLTGGMGYQLGAERLGVTVVPTGSGVTQRQVMLIEDLGVTVLACAPSYALVLSEAIAREKVRTKLKLRVGFFGAEPWSDGMRHQIEYGLGLEAYDVYGLTELGGPGVAAECREHDGLHILEDFFYAEVIHPDTGRVVEDGTDGELVITSLRREATPVLRYRTRDRSVLVSEPCPCGNPARRIRKVRGRTDDLLMLNGGNVFPSQIEAILLQVEGLTGNYQLVVDRQAKQLDTLQVLVEAVDGADGDALRREARERIRETIGLECTVTVLGSGILPRFEDRASRVVDRRRQ